MRTRRGGNLKRISMHRYEGLKYMGKISRGKLERIMTCKRDIKDVHRNSSNIRVCG